VPTSELFVTRSGVTLILLEFSQLLVKLVRNNVVATWLIALIAGLLAGSTAAAMSYRLSHGLPLFNDRSRCPSCGAQIAFYDNVPVLSWLLLGGKCRTCRGRIAIRYPVIELAGVMMATLALRASHYLAQGVEVFLALIIALIAALVDAESFRIPNKLTYGGSVLMVGSGIAFAFLENSWFILERALLSGTFLFLIFVVLRLVSRGGMGMGDAKLAFVIGMGAGWLGIAYVLVSQVAAFALGSGVGLYLILTGKGSRKTRLAFAPYMFAGLVVATLSAAVHP
jgi:leader peptidase (prepilin peptidase)/N-methyltransferase